MFMLMWLIGDQSRFNNFLGMTSPRMNPYWDRVFRPWAYSWNVPEALMNVMARWNEHDPDKGWKVMFDFALLMFVLGLLIG